MVAEQLDHPDTQIPDAGAFALLAGAFRRVGLPQLPLQAVLGRVWANSDAQLALLRHAVAAPPELFSFAGSTCKQVKKGLGIF